MKKQELKSLVKECIKTILNENFMTENAKDPTREEMMQFLQQAFGGYGEEGFQDSAEVAMYWFANHYHGGQWSNLYSVLSTSPFSPGPISRGPEPNSLEEDMYKALEAEFGGKEHQHGEDTFQENAKQKVLKYLDNNYYILSPEQAKELSVDGQLPRPGYEKKADLSKLQGYQVDFHGQIQPLKISPDTLGWIHLTPVGNEQVWAIRLYDKDFTQTGIKEDGAVGGGTGMGMSVTGAVQGYSTPNAFGKKRKVKENDDFSGEWTPKMKNV